MPIDYEEDTEVEVRCPQCASCWMCGGKSKLVLRVLVELRELLNKAKVR